MRAIRTSIPYREVILEAKTWPAFKQTEARLKRDKALHAAQMRESTRLLRELRLATKNYLKSVLKEADIKKRCGIHRTLLYRIVFLVRRKMVEKQATKVRQEMARASKVGSVSHD